MNQRYIPEEADIVSRCRAVTKPGSYYLLPEANRVETVLPGFKGAFSRVLVTPSVGAGFIQHELHIEPGGGTEKPISNRLEHFLFVLEGNLTVVIEGEKRELDEGGYVYLPEKTDFTIENTGNRKSRVLWTKKQYKKIDGVKPQLIVSNEKRVEAVPVDTYMEQHLIPHEEDISYDLAFNILNFEPGIYFGFVESHIMEHGIYMLEGRGLYWLGGDYHEVQKDDYIYIAPYCPQFFYSTGWERGRYLLYKDVNRDFDGDLQIGE